MKQSAKELLCAVTYHELRGIPLSLLFVCTFCNRSYYVHELFDAKDSWRLAAPLHIPNTARRIIVRNLNYKDGTIIYEPVR